MTSWRGRGARRPSADIGWRRNVWIGPTIVLAILRGWADSIGPFTAAELAARLSLPLSDVEIALAQLEGEGSDSAREFHGHAIMSFVIGAFWRAFIGRRWDGCGARSSR